MLGAARWQVNVMRGIDAAGSTREREEHPRELRPNLDRLTVGVDLGDQGSHYCIL